MLPFTIRLFGKVAPMLRATHALLRSVGAAQRCAYAAELGRRPAPEDLEQLGLRQEDAAPLLRA